MLTFSCVFCHLARFRAQFLDGLLAIAGEQVGSVHVFGAARIRDVEQTEPSAGGQQFANARNRQFLLAPVEHVVQVAAEYGLELPGDRRGLIDIADADLDPRNVVDVAVHCL